jgi:hypothetical protein
VGTISVTAIYFIISISVEYGFGVLTLDGDSLGASHSAGWCRLLFCISSGKQA